MSRGARLALHARSDFDLDISTRELCGPLLSQSVEVEVMELVMDKRKSHDQLMRHNRSHDTSRRSGLRNFKRFRKSVSSLFVHVSHSFVMVV